MAGLVPAIHVLFRGTKDVDARQRRQVYAVCASLTALPGMTEENLTRPGLKPRQIDPSRSLRQLFLHQSSARRGRVPDRGVLPDHGGKFGWRIGDALEPVVAEQALHL